jgi:cell division septal protein FtsQ
VTALRTRLASPRAPAAGLPDLGERRAFIARQRVGAHRRRRRRRMVRAARLAAALGLAVLGVAGGTAATRWLLTAPRFAITRVEVEGASRVSADRVRSAAAIAPGANIWRLDPAAVAARVTAMPEIRRAEVIRRFPSHVTILVEERRPFTLVHAGRLHWLDEEGRVLDEVSQAVAPAVPVVSGLSEAELTSVRTDPSPRAREAVALIRMLLRTGSALTQEISEIDVSRGDGPVLYTVDGVEIRLGTDEWEDRLARLERVLRQVGRDGEAVRAIDLRFRDQVVLTKGGQG